MANQSSQSARDALMATVQAQLNRISDATAKIAAQEAAAQEAAAQEAARADELAYEQRGAELEARALKHEEHLLKLGLTYPFESERLHYHRDGISLRSYRLHPNCIMHGRRTSDMPPKEQDLLVLSTLRRSPNSGFLEPYMALVEEASVDALQWFLTLTDEGFLELASEAYAKEAEKLEAQLIHKENDP